MRLFRFALLMLMVAVVTGCAGSPYYYGGTGYRAQTNIGGVPVGGSLGLHATPSGIMLSPQILLSPAYKTWSR